MTEPPLRHRRAGVVAGAAFLLLATALWLPWWVVSSHVAGSATAAASVAPFGSDPAVHKWAQWVTVGLVAAAIVLAFVRVASRGWAHEPAAWRRDLVVAAVLVVLALASGMLWPTAEAGLPFWGGRTYLLDNATGAQQTLVAMPGLGWWTALVALLLLGVSRWMSRPERAD